MCFPKLIATVMPHTASAAWLGGDNAGGNIPARAAVRSGDQNCSCAVGAVAVAGSGSFRRTARATADECSVDATDRQQGKSSCTLHTKAAAPMRIMRENGAGRRQLPRCTLFLMRVRHSLCVAFVGVPASFQVFVRDAFDGPLRAVQVAHDERVTTVSERLTALLGYAVRALTYNGKPLPARRTLAEAGVSVAATLRVHSTGLAGGMLTPMRKRAAVPKATVGTSSRCLILRRLCLTLVSLILPCIVCSRLLRRPGPR